MQSQEISILGFSWGMGGSVRPKNLKKCLTLNCNFQRGGVLEKIHFVGEVWMFSGITQCILSMILPKCHKGDFGSHNLFKRIKRVVSV